MRPILGSTKKFNIHHRYGVNDRCYPLFSRIANVENSFHLQYLEPRGLPSDATPKLISLVTGGCTVYDSNTSCYNATHLCYRDIDYLSTFEDGQERYTPALFYTLEDYEKKLKGDDSIKPRTYEFLADYDTVVCNQKGAYRYRGRLSGRFFTEEEWTAMTSEDRARAIDVCWTYTYGARSTSGFEKTSTGFVMTQPKLERAIKNERDQSNIDKFVQWCDDLQNKHFPSEDYYLFFGLTSRSL